ncbi:hypothetical protein ACWD01_01705 [Streptomyces sp. NPDC002835]
MREWTADFTTGFRYALRLIARGALALMLLAGTYCVVRGRWRR